MKMSCIVTFLAASVGLWAQAGMPRAYSADPGSGKAGDVIVVTGDNLDQQCVTKAFLTADNHDIAVEVIEQTNTTLKFKIPAKTQPGRYAVMLLTFGKDPKYIEEPVKVTVEP